MLVKTNIFVACIVASLLNGAAYAKPSAPDQKVPLENLRNFTYIFERIKSNYVEDIDDKQLMENAIRGMLNGLDPHSNYLDADEYKELKISTSGQFGGLGLQVSMDDGFIRIISPIDDTPASRAGILPGDTIIRIDKTHVKGLTLNKAVKLMRGKPGSSITLTIRREKNNKPIIFSLERAIIKVESVKYEMLTEGYAYVRIASFQSQTAVHLRTALDNLADENKAALKGLVLDLRNNPGGVLNAAADVADLFIKKGLLVYTKGRMPQSFTEFKANNNDQLKGAPIVVLINAGSASAAEIVAGALQDHKRAVLIGDKSFGKGSVQTIQELPNGGAVKFTTARYFTPSGRSIQAQGITPDIYLKEIKFKASKKTSNMIKEVDLAGHISNPENPSEEPTIKKSEAKILSDYKVQEALNLLKAVYILNTNKIKP